jgi:PadR family transcriptional regulator PadR
MAATIELPPGTLDLLILQTRTLAPQPDALRIQQGSLYPALHRRERRGWISACWEFRKTNDAKYYELTKAGRRQLELEKDAWLKLTAVMAQVLGMA